MAFALRTIALKSVQATCTQRMLRLWNRLPRSRSWLRVLTYHRIDDHDANENYDPALISASPDEFATQMAMLARDYNVISFPTFEKVYETGSSLPARSVLLTFDDATTDFATHAWPILRALQLPAAVFVPTSYPDTNHHFWWDRLYRFVEQGRFKNKPLELPRHRVTKTLVAKHRGFTSDRCLLGETKHARSLQLRVLKRLYKALPTAVAEPWLDRIEEQSSDLSRPPSNNVLGWQALRELSSDGVTLLPHTRTHPMLAKTDLDRVQHEILGSKKDLESNLGHEVPCAIAYPAGSVNTHVRSATKTAGFHFGFTTEPGANHVRHADRFLLRRLNVGRASTSAVLRARLALPARFAR